MLKTKIIFDNKVAADEIINYVRDHYISDVGKDDLVKIEVEEGDYDVNESRKRDVIPHPGSNDAFDEIGELSVHNPLIHQFLTMGRKGGYFKTYGQMLEQIVIALAKMNKVHKEQLIDMIANRPPPNYIIPKDN